MQYTIKTVDFTGAMDAHSYYPIVPFTWSLISHKLFLFGTACQQPFRRQDKFQFNTSKGNNG